MFKAKCPVCCTQISGKASFCEDCETPHHVDCWSYFGGCAIYGCSQRATNKERRTLHNLLDWHYWYTKLLLSMSVILGFVLLSPIVVAPLLWRYGWFSPSETIKSTLNVPSALLSYVFFFLLILCMNHVYFQLRLGYLVSAETKSSFRLSVVKGKSLSSALERFEPLFNHFVRYIEYGCFIFWTAIFLSFIGRIYGQPCLIGFNGMVLQDTFCIYLVLVSPIVLAYSNLVFLRKLHRPGYLLAADGTSSSMVAQSSSFEKPNFLSLR